MDLFQVLGACCVRREIKDRRVWDLYPLRSVVAMFEHTAHVVLAPHLSPLNPWL